MAGVKIRAVRDRGAKKKTCLRCDYRGRVNEDTMCKRCEEEVTSKKEICNKCERWVGEEEDGRSCDGCSNWRHRVCEPISQEANTQSLKV